MVFRPQGIIPRRGSAAGPRPVEGDAQ
jgi:hypothetical protein